MLFLPDLVYSILPIILPLLLVFILHIVLLHIIIRLLPNHVRNMFYPTSHRFFDDEDTFQLKSLNQPTETPVIHHISKIEELEIESTKILRLPYKLEPDNKNLYTIFRLNHDRILLASQHYETLFRYILQFAPTLPFNNNIMICVTFSAIYTCHDEEDVLFQQKRFITAILHYFFCTSFDWIVIDLQDRAPIPSSLNFLAQHFSSHLFHNKLLVKFFTGKTYDAIQEVMEFKSDRPTIIFTISIKNGKLPSSTPQTLFILEIHLINSKSILTSDH